VKRNLELVSVIDSVSVERVLPRTLKIRVTERDPIRRLTCRARTARTALQFPFFNWTRTAW